jgi:hypothetical protein
VSDSGTTLAIVYYTLVRRDGEGKRGGGEEGGVCVRGLAKKK